ncbi:MAG: STAS domain-containing protein, partial [Nannocystaceae bacterium]
DLTNGELSFFGLPSVLFWANPSMYRMLKAFADQIGTEMFELLMAHESSKGTDEDYNAMITQLADNFPEGFLAWGRAVTTAGWGLFELPEYNLERKHAVVRVKNPWELKMLKGTGDHWGCPFLQGKLIGIFSHAFGTTCWADISAIDGESSDLFVEFRIYPGTRTIPDELKRMRALLQDSKERGLQEAVEQATRDLSKQKSLVHALSTPMIQVWDGILVMPLIGEVDDERASVLTQNVLAAISARRTTHLIIDITGVGKLDVRAANHLSRLVAAARLLGTDCLLAGVSPQIAQTLIATDTKLPEVPSYATTETALKRVLRGRGVQ